MSNKENENSLNSSKLRFYSIGIVAKNKLLDTDEIECTPIEELNMLEGEIHSKVTTIKTKGTGDINKGYTADVLTTITIKAKWLPIHNSNRMTSPDVRRGETIMIYQFSDADKYYWCTLKQDSELRKLETVVYAFSATTDDTSKNTKEDYYYLSVSTHKGMIAFHTTTKNKEPFSYDIKIDTKQGEVIIKDDIGNIFHLTSKTNRLLMKNASNSVVDISKENILIKSSKSVQIVTNVFNVVSPNSIIEGKVTTTNNVTISGEMKSNTITTGHITSKSATGRYPK